MPDAPEVILTEKDREGLWGRQLMADAAQARRTAEERLGVHLESPPRIVSYYPEQEFFEAIGRRPHNILAVAQGHEHRIIINRQRYLAQNPIERRRTLVHEFVHLILDERVPGHVPRWLHEGLAMIVAGEDTIGYSMRVAIAASFGGLAPLDQLFSGPQGPRADQELAYAQSLSATRFFLETRAQRRNGDPDPKALMQTLIDPRRGEPLRRLLNDPGYIRALDRQWRESLRSFWTFIAALSTGGILWGAMAFLLVFAVWRKKKRAEEKASAWDAEQRLHGELEAEWTPDLEELEEWMEER